MCLDDITIIIKVSESNVSALQFVNENVFITLLNRFAAPVGSALYRRRTNNPNYDQVSDKLTHTYIIAYIPVLYIYIPVYIHVCV